MDKAMRTGNVSGRSVVPLICRLIYAIPAIMVTRTIDNWKDRPLPYSLPFIELSARLPVFYHSLWY